MYGDTHYISAFDYHAECLKTNLGCVVNSLIDFECFVDTFVDKETQSALRHTLFLYIAAAHEYVANCQNLFDNLLKDSTEVSNEK